MSADIGTGATFRDRALRLRTFGVLGILLGLVGLFLAVFQLSIPLLARMLPELSGLSVDFRAVLSGAILNAILGGLMLGVGVGAFRMARWAPPIMRTLAWTWLLTGLLTTVLVAGMLDSFVSMSSGELPPLSPAVEGLVRVVVIVACVVGGVLLPALFVWGFSDRDVDRTCERHDPRPSWTSACPPRVLGLSIGLGLVALVLLPTAAKPVVPWFGMLVTGGPGTALTVASAVALAWAARSIYRLERTGWWVVLAILVLLGASVVVTFLRIDPREFYRAAGYPEAQIERMGGSAAWTRTFIVWGTVAITLASVAYMTVILRYFPGRAKGPVTRSRSVRPS